VRGWRPRQDRAGRLMRTPGGRHRALIGDAARRARWPAQRVDMWNGISRSRSRVRALDDSRMSR
jgi:hypothetical protein